MQMNTFAFPLMLTILFNEQAIAFLQSTFNRLKWQFIDDKSPMWLYNYQCSIIKFSCFEVNIFFLSSNIKAWDDSFKSHKHTCHLKTFVTNLVTMYIDLYVSPLSLLYICNESFNKVKKVLKKMENSLKVYRLNY